MSQGNAGLDVQDFGIGTGVSSALAILELRLALPRPTAARS